VTDVTRDQHPYREMQLGLQLQASDLQVRSQMAPGSHLLLNLRESRKALELSLHIGVSYMAVYEERAVVYYGGLEFR